MFDLEAGTLGYKEVVKRIGKRMRHRSYLFCARAFTWKPPKAVFNGDSQNPYHAYFSNLRKVTEIPINVNILLKICPLCGNILIARKFERTYRARDSVIALRALFCLDLVLYASLMAEIIKKQFFKTKFL